MASTHYSHPGKILQRVFLADYGLSVNAAAKAMGLSRQRLSDVVKGNRAITAETALCLGRFFGNSPQFWLNLQTHYDLAEAEITSRLRLKKIVPVTAIVAH
jgi:addiction module HigA family antidote